MPAGTAARVRSLHTQNRAADSGQRGQRCALNLAGLGRSAITRGDWLAEPQLLSPSRRIDARLRPLPGSRLRLGSWTALHVHLGTLHRVAHVTPLQAPPRRGGRFAARATGVRRAGVRAARRSLHPARRAGPAHRGRRRGAGSVRARRAAAAARSGGAGSTPSSSSPRGQASSRCCKPRPSGRG